MTHPQNSAFPTDIVRDRLWEVARMGPPIPLYAEMDSRKIRGPSGYAHPSLFPFSMATSLMAAWPGYPIPGHALDKATKDMIVAARVAYNYQAPRYFVGRELLEACDHTRLDVGGMALGDIKWPLETMCFYLPLGAIETPADGDLLFVGFALAGEGFSEIGGIPTAFTIAPAERSVVFFGQARSGVVFAGLGKRDASIAAVLAAEYDPGLAYGAEPAGPGVLHYPLTGRTALVEGDKAFLGNMMSLVVRLVLAVNTAPDLVEEGVVVKPRKVSKGRTHPEEWSPSFIGKSFTVAREPAASGGGASPRPHWRLGHIRHQRYGAENRQVKVIWIRPTLVGATQPSAGI